MPNVEASSDGVVPGVSGYFVGNYKWTSMFGCWSAFISGVLAILLIEAVVLMFVVMRSVEKKLRPSVPHTSSISVQSLENRLDIQLKGGVWITALPTGDIKKMYTKREKAVREKLAKEERSEAEKGGSNTKKRDLLKDYTLISPVFRKAKLQGNILHLSNSGTSEHIRLEGCSILSVSGSMEATRKWAKKYPIKVHHPTREVYGGSHNCLLYLDTGWEKEKWCEVLRAAARPENSTGDWFYKLKKEYRDYLQRVEEQFPFFSRVNSGKLAYIGEDRTRYVKGELNSSTTKKSRLIWKRLTRRSMKSNRDNKSSEIRLDLQRSGEVRSEVIAAAEEGSSRGSTSSVGGALGVAGSASTDENVPDASLVTEESIRLASSSSRSTESNSESQAGDSTMEQSLLCFNALFARMFFDLYHSEAVVSRIRSTLQRQLSKVPTPAYIGKIDCTHLDLGNSPPLARNVSLLPVNEEGSWGLEADIEYHGGAILTIETRLDVRDSSSREKVAQGLEQSLPGEAAADLLARGLQTYTEELQFNDPEGIAADQRNSGATSSSTNKLGINSTLPADVRGSEEASRKGWMHSQISNLKAMMSRVAEQVSQVPLALTIKVVLLKGTLQVRVKPPPSDRVWFSFTKMPTLDLVPEPCIGDHKINSGPLGAFIVNQIKILLRETMVFPQFEDLSYRWMLSEKDNWLPREAVPLSFISEQASQDQSNDKVNRDERRSQMRKEGSSDSITRTESSGAGMGTSQSFPNHTFQYEHERPLSPILSPMGRASLSLPEISLDSASHLELTRPLLVKDEIRFEPSRRESETASVSEKALPVNIVHLQHSSSSSDSESGHLVEDRLRRQGSTSLPSGSKRAKVLGFGRKVGSKIQEKRRNVVDRMHRSNLGPDQPNE
ncbi:hypothetical protein R1sor_019335 [Riccia sorocarpa]|uniref:SMP-LTD domain-containing protein n=1 Tax=Riccia sorocarpa TaxID=122646 RepID=A0ABD3ICB9_9MARC